MVITVSLYENSFHFANDIDVSIQFFGRKFYNIQSDG